ncbi:MAG TPA: DUF3099 domain-containing protein [Mycobacteriales bacterium]|nr:DUF3099 domain-containing protein [Mycobacteriales bacterium]
MTQRSRDRDAFLVTTAPESPRDELAARQRRYLWTMAVRVVCFVLAIALYEVLPGATGVRVLSSALAMVLPWVAVVVANAGPQRKRGTPMAFTPTPRPELEPGRGSTPATAEREPPDLA